MKRCPQHKFFVLTKQAQNMATHVGLVYKKEALGRAMGFWSHVYLGISVTDQADLDRMLPDFLQVPGKKWISYEPAMGHVTFSNLDQISWLVCGGVSGPGSKPMSVEWARSVRDQCIETKIPFYMKQWGEWIPMGQCLADGREVIAAMQKGNGSYFHLAYVDVVGRETDFEGPAAYQTYEFHGGASAYRVGAKKAGNLLDGRKWEELP